MTVLGPIEPVELGVCLVHEHVSACAAGPTGERAVADELEAYASVGGRAVVDGTPPATGRHAEVLRTLATWLPVHVIASTGIPASRDGETVGPDSITAFIARASHEGIDSTGIHPGQIIVDPAESPTSGASERWQAVLRAAVTTGLPLRIHAGSLISAKTVMSEAGAAGLSPDRLILGVEDPDSRLDDLTSILADGSWVSFDAVGRGGLEADARLARVIVTLVEAGYGARVLLSEGLARRGQFVTQGGGPGWIHLLERFALQLMGAGAEAGMVRRLMVDNPAAALTIPGADAL
jgi:phosphotriesterase-related protein